MATVRAWLHDDIGQSPQWANLPPSKHVEAKNGDDAPATELAEVNPMLTVRVRTRTGYDEETGNPEFDWTEVVTGRTIMWAQRDEFDAIAGVSRSKASAVILYAGDVVVPETASVQVEDEFTYRVLSVGQYPDRLEFVLERLSGG